MITTYPARVPSFIVAIEIQAPLRRFAIRRHHVQQVENTAVLQAAIRRALEGPDRVAGRKLDRGTPDESATT